MISIYHTFYLPVMPLFARPQPSISWLRRGGILPTGRHTTDNFNTALTIHDVEFGDEGDYICRGYNVEGVIEQYIHIDVQSKSRTR